MHSQFSTHYVRGISNLNVRLAVTVVPLLSMQAALLSRRSLNKTSHHLGKKKW